MLLRHTIAEAAPWLADAYRLLRYPAIELPVWFDWLTTYRSARELRQIASEVQHRRVMVLLLTESIYETKLLMMLSAGLKLLGWRVTVVLSNPRSTHVSRYCRAFGSSDVLTLRSVKLTREHRHQCFVEANRLVDAGLRFTTIKGWTFRGAWIGPQLLSALSRQRHEGSLNLTHPDVVAQLRQMLPKLLERTLKAELLVRQSSADLAICIEANSWLIGPLVDMAIVNDIDVIQVTQPWRDDALMCKRLTKETRRVHPASLDPATMRELCNQQWTAKHERELISTLEARYSGKWFLQSRNQGRTRPQTRDDISSALRLDPDKKTAVIFPHILWDANLFYGEDLFDDYGHWLMETVRAAVSNTQLNWLIKLHPANIWKRALEGLRGPFTEETLIRETIGALPSHISVLYPDTDISSLSIYRFADYGVTVRGTPGMEMACFGKPVLTAGTGRYSGLGFTIDSISKQDYLRKLAHLHDFPPMDSESTGRAKRHAHGVFNLRPWTMISFRSQFAPSPGRNRPLTQNLLMNASSVEEILSNGDLTSWADWAGESDKVDYLENTR